MQKMLVIDPNTCTGCQQCEMACGYHHEGIFNPAKSRIRVFKFEFEGRFVPYTCTQCDEAWCMHACPVEAISINAETGAKEVSAALCVGYKVCTIACPFGTVNYNSDTGKVDKCDLCGGDPDCVKACPTSALSFKYGEQAGIDKMRNWAERSDSGNHVTAKSYSDDDVADYLHKLT